MKNVLVLGASLKVDRYSNMAMKKLDAKGFSVLSLGKNKGFVGSMQIRAEEFLINDLYAISMYLNARNQVDYYDYIIELKPRKVIFNPGSENKALEILLDTHNIIHERACTLVLLSIGQF